jgi:hypothetical protein
MSDAFILQASSNDKHHRLSLTSVDGDTGTKKGTGRLQVETVWDLGQVSSTGDGILLEGAVNSVSGALSLCACRLVTASTLVALKA